MPSRRSVGVFDRIQRLFSRPAPIRVAAKLRLSNESRLVITFEPGAIDWQLPEHLDAALEDGSTVTLEIDPQRSTARAQLTVGQEVRLVCSLTAALPAPPLSLTFTANGSDFLVTLSP